MDPESGKPQFRCPHCNIVAKQSWADCNSLSDHLADIRQQFFLSYRERIQDYDQKRISEFLQTLEHTFPHVLDRFMPRELSLSTGHNCEATSVWMNDQLIFPRATLVDPPNADLEPDIIIIYNEAASIVADSPKGAAALLRLALQKVLVQIGEPGKNINDDIKSLVTKGLSPKIQKALDFVRVVGNNAVHPGQISFDDDRNVALTMFRLMNLIAEEMITRPKEIDSLYDDVVPDATKEHIKKRDGTT